MGKWVDNGRWMRGCVSEWMSYMDASLGRWIAGQICRYMMDGWMNGWTDEWVAGWMSGWMGG